MGSKARYGIVRFKNGSGVIVSHRIVIESRSLLRIKIVISGKFTKIIDHVVDYVFLVLANDQTGIGEAIRWHAKSKTISLD
jgi:hypothetical protein